MKKLPLEIQALFSSLTPINSYKKVVEELVYNALDAEATSIAIRVNIDESTIQVIDNGCGTASSDFKLLGQQYATSKHDGSFNFNSMPSKYGHRGLSLSRIVEVSRSLRITSRLEMSNDTWLKIFDNIKGVEIKQTKTRPSKGTTVEVNGFLYNHNIQNKNINPLQEIGEIKVFLEHLSLVHNNISLSFRDDSKNELLFQLHKNRDVYQTLSLLFGIERTEFQELKVEKDKYKVVGLIGTRKGQHKHYKSIFVNRVHVHVHKLYKLFNDCFMKGNNSDRTGKRLKKTAYNCVEDIIARDDSPFYFIFITCPYSDYNLSYDKCSLELKRWDKIQTILNKLISFYTGEAKLKSVKSGVEQSKNEEKGVADGNDETREQVRKIIEKFLGNKSKRLGVSQMNKGIKGKLLKRKKKQKSPPTSSNHQNKNITNDKFKIDFEDNDSYYENDARFNLNFCPNNNKKAKDIFKYIDKSETSENLAKRKQKRKKTDAVLKKFEKPPESLKLRCAKLNKKVKEMENYFKKISSKRTVHLNNAVKYNDGDCSSTNYILRKKTNEYVIREYYYPKKTGKNNSVVQALTTYDLIHTVTGSHSGFHGKESENFQSLNNCVESNNNKTLQQAHELIDLCDFSNFKLTYESHSFQERKEHRTVINNYNVHEGNSIKRNHQFVKNYLIRKFNLGKGNLCFNDLPNELKATNRNTDKNVEDNSFQSINRSYYFTDSFYHTLSQRDNETSVKNQKYNENVFSYAVQSNQTYVIDTNGVRNDICENVNYIQVPKKGEKNFIFISNSPHTSQVTNLDNNIEPLNICETILNVHEDEDLKTSLNSKLDENLYNLNETKNEINNLNVTHYEFSQKLTHSENNLDTLIDENDKCLLFKTQSKEDSQSTTSMNVHSEDFLFKNRFRFLPKGMSPILENCNTKIICDYNNIKEDYYEHNIYKKFASDVQVNSEVFEPKVQKVKNLTSKNITKLSKKVNIDEASLTFNGQSLRDAIILGQVDSKFIAAILKGKCSKFSSTSNYLMLFDQHAVHERINLEKNMADYFHVDRWKSTSLDGFVLKLAEDEILYLYNYKEKFNQLGLDWVVINSNEIKLYSIPEAILGKHHREADIILKAVRNLIMEEIYTLKCQKGNISLYPKSIMDLVFSEACRYAKKFGDPLSKTDCTNLIASLSECKTPFQCAHGRPVMAVLMEIKASQRDYAVNFINIKNFNTPQPSRR